MLSHSGPVVLTSSTHSHNSLVAAEAAKVVIIVVNCSTSSRCNQWRSINSLDWQPMG